jgi:O-antigen ligase/Flp pilus assembly protein TadD
VSEEPASLVWTASVDTNRPLPAQEGARLDAAVVVVGVVALVTLALPALLFESWTPRFAALSAVGVTGLVHLARSAWRRQSPSVVAFVILGWVWLTALASSAPRSSSLGFVGRDLSAVIVTLALGCWALGRYAAVDGLWMSRVFVGACTVVSVIGLAQVVVGVDTGFFALQSGRPASLLVNPVYFGAVCAAGCVVAVYLSAVNGVDLLSTIAVVVLGAGVSTSGSRVALAALAATVAVLVAVKRTRAFAVAAGLAAAGVSLGVILDVATGSGRNAASRLAADGADGRFVVWRYGLEASLDRPLFGYGMGRFRPSVQDRFSDGFVADHATVDRAQAWFDPHNVVILVLVGTGFVGLGLVGVWVVLASKGCSGPLAWGVAALSATWLLQPVSIHTLPVAMLLFGASAASDSEAQRMALTTQAGGARPAASRSLAITSVVALGVGVVAAAWLLVADLRLNRAVDRLSPAAAESAAAMYPSDPIVADVVAQVHELTGDAREWLAWREKATEIEPDRPYWWVQLGEAALATGDLDRARSAADRALALQPTNVGANDLDARLAAASGDVDGLRSALQRLCDLGQPTCDLDAEEIIRESEGA